MASMKLKHENNFDIAVAVCEAALFLIHASLVEDVSYSIGYMYNLLFII